MGLDRVRALLWVGRVDEAEAVGEGGAVARASIALARGEPSRARLLLHDAQEDGVLASLVHAEATRAAGDAGVALQLAGRAVDQADGAWLPIARLTLARCLAGAGSDPLASAVLDEVMPSLRGLLRAEGLDARAHVARGLGDPARAVLGHQRALEMWLTLGEDALPVASCRFQLAQALHRSGDPATALDEMSRAFLATQRALGPDHLDTWTTRFELGRMELDAGDPFSGLPRMQAAHAEVRQRLGPQHPIVRAMEVYVSSGD